MSKLLVIGFNLNNMKFTERIVDFNPENRLKDYYDLIDCDCIDIVTLSNDVSVIVDDEGFLKSGNPVFEVKYNGYIHQLAGTMVFVKNVYTNEGIDSAGFNDPELVDLFLKLKITMIGVTN